MTSASKGQLLTLNVGSSSIKFKLYEASAYLPVVSSGQIAHIGSSPELTMDGKTRAITAACVAEALEILLEQHILPHAGSLMAVGHRVVCGGTEFTHPAWLTDEVLSKLEELNPIVPLHQPHNLAAVRMITKHHPQLRQLACFDTAFHHTLEPLRYRYALPTNNLHIRRYGYHGLSYEWIASQLEKQHAELYVGKVIVAHIGSGVSLCAMQAGKSVDTTMGMTALEGPIMATRSGSVDPGALLYMQREMGLSADELEQKLYKSSGLKVLCGESDMRAIRKLQTDEAKFALEYFVHSIAKQAAQLSVSLGGLDALIFTGGIGENDADMRERIAAKLAHLGAFHTLVIPTDEERVMVQHLQRFLENG